MMAYTAGFTLTVKKQSQGLDDLKMLAEKLGGYLVSSARGNMKIKVPVKKADEFLKTAGNYGKLSDFRISAEDLTDTITDLQVRLDNLRKLRTRLTELLAKAKNVDEMLKVERELNRVTTEIERMDAQLQNNKNRVDFVTFDIAVIEEHGAIPVGAPQAIDYFKFLEKLSTFCGGTEDEALFDLPTPDDFVCISTGKIYRGFSATTSDDCVFRTWETEIPDDGTLKFWESMISRALSTLHKYNNIKCEPITFDGKEAVKITAEQTNTRGIQYYWAVIRIKRNCLGSDELQIIEFFGPQKAFEKHEKAVTSAILK